MSPDPYDKIPYPAMEHSSRLSLSNISLLADGADPSTAKVLEFGCAQGAALLRQAKKFPGATFLGVDLSAAHVADAQERIERSGLTNIEVIQGDLCDVELVGDFDYVLAHGIYSWVPAPVRDRLLERAAGVLDANGVFMLSFATNPHGAVQGMLVRLVRRRVAHIEDVEERVAAAVEHLTEFARKLPQGHPWGFLLASMIDKEFAGYRLAVIAHDQFGPVTEAFDVETFVNHVAGYGFRYAADLDVPGPMDDLDAQMESDLISFRGFRAALLKGSS